MADDPYTAFAGGRRLASGSSEQVAQAAKAAQAAGASHVLIFKDATGEQVEVDPFSDPPAIAGHASPAPRPRGRPKLGVAAREVTLLPRHWDWLARQPGGASAALRRLVEAASRDASETARQTRDAAYRAMTSLAGDLPGYEDAVRALFAGDAAGFEARVRAWPGDVADYVSRLAAAAWPARA